VERRRLEADYACNALGILKHSSLGEDKILKMHMNMLNATKKSQQIKSCLRICGVIQVLFEKGDAANMVNYRLISLATKAGFRSIQT